MGLQAKIIILPLCLLVLFSTTYSAGAQHRTSPEIIEGFRRGDCDLLTNHFSETVKLSILNQEYESSPKEATGILRKFFADNRPVDFEIKFESEKKDSKFVVAILSTKNEKYRINLFFRTTGNKDVIHLLRIEKGNEGLF